MDWRIATTEGGLARNTFFNLRIPVPDLPNYRDHTTIAQRSDGSDATRGFINNVIMWDRLTGTEGYELKRLVQIARTGAGVLFMTIPRLNGDGIGNDFIDLSGFPQYLLLTPAGGHSRRHGPVIYSNVRLVFNNITVVNDPSLFST